MQRTALFALTVLLSVPAVAQDVAPTAGEQMSGVLAFEIRDVSGALIPGRLTFVKGDDLKPRLFPNVTAAEDDLGVRHNVIYTLHGKASVTVPVGTYTVYASRGLEWSLDKTEITIEEGRTAAWTAKLEHEVDTTGWVSGDFHLHTLTYSGHGDSQMKERIVSIVGEGLEFAVATDHNHNTDYQPTIDEIGAGDKLAAVVGNEVSTGIGHFNAFPLDPTRPVPEPRIGDANELFKIIRSEPNEFGITPVIQLNHPRWSEINYFGQTGLDPITGAPTMDTYSADFDTLEVLNENEGWGYFAAGTTPYFTGSNNHSVLQDWFNLLNRGHVYAAVGNSDSHTVHEDFAAYPRNYMPSTTDDPARIDPVEMARRLRDRQVFTTFGPFVEFSVEGTSMGGQVTSADGAVQASIRVQAASWIDVDVVKIVVNGDIVDTIRVPESTDPVRLDVTHPVRMTRDGWIALLVEGDKSLSPILPDQGRPILPFAVINPVWVDADGDGRVISPWEQANAFIMNAPSLLEVRERLPLTGVSDRAMMVVASAEQGKPFAEQLIRIELHQKDRGVKLAALRAAEILAKPSLATDVERVLARDEADPFVRISAMRALKACDPNKAEAVFAELLGAMRAGELGPYAEEITDAMPGAFVQTWTVVGYFPAPEQGTVLTRDFGPENQVDGSFTGKEGGQVSWALKYADANGYLNLQSVPGSAGASSNAIAYAQTWLHSESVREVTFAFGCDDGGRISVNGVTLYESDERKGANPMEHIGTMTLRPGWNRVLVKVENGDGGFGLYFRPFADVRASARPE
jgi:hypothetical protein